MLHFLHKVSVQSFPYRLNSIYSLSLYLATALLFALHKWALAEFLDMFNFRKSWYHIFLNHIVSPLCITHYIFILYYLTLSGIDMLHCVFPHCNFIFHLLLNMSTYENVECWKGSPRILRGIFFLIESNFSSLDIDSPIFY